MQGDMKQRLKRKILAVALAFPLMVAGCVSSASASISAPPQPPLAAAQALLPGEVLVSKAGDVAGMWKLDTGAGWMQLYFGKGRFRYGFEDELVDSGSFWVQDGKLTLATETAMRSYLVYAKKESGQPAQIRFVLIPESSYSGSDWYVTVDGKTLTPFKQ